MKKHNGFTLIELLAVIVILAVIALIATPLVMGVIEDSKKGALVDTAYAIIKSGENYLGTEQLKNSDAPTFLVDEDLSKSTKLEYKGTKPSAGRLSIKKDGKASIAIWNGKYCIRKGFDDEKVTVLEGIQSQNRCVLGANPTDEKCFTYYEPTSTITSYNCHSRNTQGLPTITDVVIPDKINGKPVLDLGLRSFSNRGITSISMPEGLTEIDYGVFDSNLLKTLEIPDNVTKIGQYAFGDNPLESVKLSKNLVTIEARAFKNTLLKSIEFPPSVKGIGEESFSGNQFTNLVIPKTVVNIGPGAFNLGQLPDAQAFIYARNNDGSENKAKVVSYGGTKKEIVIPNTITIIGSMAFKDIGLKSVELSSNIKTIEKSAFERNQLLNITIPSSVTSIGTSAFERNQLVSVVIPNSVMGISDYAFRYNKLTGVKIDGKTGVSDFSWYNQNIWGWESGYSDANITWNAIQ